MNKYAHLRLLYLLATGVNYKMLLLLMNALACGVDHCLQHFS